MLVGLGARRDLLVYVRRRSLREEKIYGGTLAQVFHYPRRPRLLHDTADRHQRRCCCAAASCRRVALGFGCVIAGIYRLLIFAVIERPARAGIAPEEEVWTEEKARSSDYEYPL